MHKNIYTTKLASYKAPRRVLFVTEDELELTGTAKIKSTLVRKLAARRIAAGTRSM